MERTKFLEMWREIRSVFDNVIDKYDDIWIKRQRKITTRFLVLFIIRLTIPKDDRGYGNTLLEIFNIFTDLDIHNQINSLAPSSICEARMKLDPIIFKELHRGIVDVWDRYNDNENPQRWCGLQVLAEDGSKLNLPRELVKSGYKTPGDHSHYPLGLLSATYDVLTGIPLDFDFVSHLNERTCALEHLKYTTADSVKVYDRGYLGWHMLSAHITEERPAIMRVPSLTYYKAIDDFWLSNETDKDVLLLPPKGIIEEARREQKQGSSNIKLDPIPARLIKYTIEDNTYVLVTMLLGDREKYPESCFSEAYHSRWGIEELYKLSKVITGVKDFHSKSEIGIKQEVYAHFIVITLLKIIESQSHYDLKKEDKTPVVPKRRLKPFPKKLPANTPSVNLIASTNDINASPRPSESTISAQKESDVAERKVKINQKSCFLEIGWILEKLLYFDISRFITKTINSTIDSIKKLHQKVRPGRSYPRVSKTPASKWIYRSAKETGQKDCAGTA